MPPKPQSSSEDDYSSSDSSSSSGSSSDSEPKTTSVKPTAASASTGAGGNKKPSAFAAFANDSDSSDDDSSSSSDDSAPPAKAADAANKNRYEEDYSDSESDGGRVVKSAEAKALDALTKASKDVRLRLKEGDWPQVKDTFDALNKIYGKQAKFLSSKQAPDVYLETLVALETSILAIATDMAAQKKLSKARFKAWSALNIRLPKAMEPYRKDLAAMQERKANAPQSSPTSAGGSASKDESDDEDSSSSSSDSSSSDSSDSSDSSSGSEESSSGSDSDSDESDSEFENASTSSSSSSDSEPGKPKLVGRAKWVKRTLVQTERVFKADSGQAAQDEAKRRRKVQEMERRRAALLQEETERRAREAAVVLTASDVERLIAASVSRMWKRDANRREITEQLRSHCSRAIPFGPRVLLPALMHLISSQFESRGIDDVMPQDKWNTAVQDMHYVLRVLDAHPEVRIVPMTSEESFDVSNAAASSNNENVEDILAEAASASNGDANLAKARAERARITRDKDLKDRGVDLNVVSVVGDVAVFATRLATEFTKALRSTTSHTQQFLDRLADESTLLSLAEAVQSYLERVGDMAGVAKQALLRIELIHFKHDSVALPAHAARVKANLIGNAVHPAAVGGTSSATSFDAQVAHPGHYYNAPAPATPYDPSKLLDDLLTVVYMHGDESSRVRAMLCRIYHYALHDRYYEARDLMLMSKLQDVILNAEVDTQILFNRAMAQIGLCAFRADLLEDAHACLNELCSQNRAKEFLAQGVSWRKKERDVEKENVERRRLVPYHQQINLDLLEFCHLTSAMLLDVPVMAAANSTTAVLNNAWSRDAPQPVSRSFRRMFDTYKRQVFTGPPENSKDRIMASGRCLLEGDWLQAAEFLEDLPVWDLMMNAETVKARITSRIKREALRAYLLTYAPQFDALDASTLCETYDLSTDVVRGIVSKLILSKELFASWDGDMIVLQKVEPSRLQALAASFADKTRELVEHNERALEKLTGSGTTNDRRGGDDEHHGGGGGRSSSGWRGGSGGGYRGRGGGGGFRRGGSSSRGRGGALGGSGGRSYSKPSSAGRGVSANA